MGTGNSAGHVGILLILVDNRLREADETHAEAPVPAPVGRLGWSCDIRIGPVAGAPQGPGRAVAPVQTGPVTAFRATNYEVHASMDAVGQVMNAQAKVDFIANEASRIVEVELNQNLRVNSVRDTAGKPVTYDRDDSLLQKLDVTLPDPVPAGRKGHAAV